MYVLILVRSTRQQTAYHLDHLALIIVVSACVTFVLNRRLELAIEKEIVSTFVRCSHVPLLTIAVTHIGEYSSTAQHDRRHFGQHGQLSTLAHAAHLCAALL
jgi:hypothetical protein